MPRPRTPFSFLLWEIQSADQKFSRVELQERSPECEVV